MTTSFSSSPSSYPKAPVLVADGIILFVALLIKWTGSSPLGIVEKTGIAACAVLAGVITALPFALDYKRRKAVPLATLAEPIATAPVPAPVETPAWVEAFAAFQSRLDTLEQNLAGTVTAGTASLRPLIEEVCANEAQARAVLSEGIQLAVTTSQRVTSAQIDTLTSSVRAIAAEQQESIRRVLAETSAATRQDLTASADQLLARLEERWAAALAALESRITTVIRERVEAELAGERAAATRRAIAAANLSLESLPATPSSGKSRLGRGLESLITSPQAKPVAADPSLTQLSLPALETNVAPSAPLNPAPEPRQETPPPPPEEIPAEIPVILVSEQPAQHHETPSPQPETIRNLLDPFHIPENGYADLAQAIDTELAAPSRRD